jgi:hypothetical protein
MRFSDNTIEKRYINSNNPVVLILTSHATNMMHHREHGSVGYEFCNMLVVEL